MAGNANKLRAVRPSYNYKALREADELIEVAHVGSPRVRFGNEPLKIWAFPIRWDILTVHGLTQASAEVW